MAEKDKPAPPAMLTMPPPAPDMVPKWKKAARKAAEVLRADNERLKTQNAGLKAELAKVREPLKLEIGRLEVRLKQAKETADALIALLKSRVAELEEELKEKAQAVDKAKADG